MDNSSYFSGSLCLVFGASGGIGQAICRELNARGAGIIGASRNEDAINKVFAKQGIIGQTLQADLTDSETLERELKSLVEKGNIPDHIIIAAGYDVRKPFEDHSTEDIDRSVNVNLTSLVEICKVLYPRFLERKSGTLTYVGGFGDGSLAFPFYSVNAATRSAAKTFLEALNREIPTDKPDAKAIRFLYFGPTAVMTESEKEFLPLWKKMGTPIISPDKVAHTLLKSIERKKTSVAIGSLTWFGIVTNAISTNLSNTLFMNGYKKVLEPIFRAKAQI